MDLQIVYHILSIISLGYGGWKGLLWFKETKVGKYVIGFFLIPYIFWIYHVLSKDEFLIKLMNKLEREKITYYF